jgi:hypothetical protein
VLAAFVQGESASLSFGRRARGPGVRGFQEHKLWDMLTRLARVRRPELGPELVVER